MFSKIAMKNVAIWYILCEWVAAFLFHKGIHYDTAMVCCINTPHRQSVAFVVNKYETSDDKLNITTTNNVYMLCSLVYNCIHSMVPHYLEDVIQSVAEITLCCWLWSASSFRSCGTSNTSFITWWPRLCGCWTRCISLPQFITDGSSPHAFKKYLKLTYLAYHFRAQIRLLIV